jgi:hypothetical protein
MPGETGSAYRNRSIVKFDQKSQWSSIISTPLNLTKSITSNGISGLGNFYICGDYLCCGEYYTTDGDNWTKRTLPNEYGSEHGRSGYGIYDDGYYYLFSGKCENEISRMYVTKDFLNPGAAYPVKHIDTIFQTPGGI